MTYRHHRQSGPPLQERIGWTGALACLSGTLVFFGSAFWLVGFTEGAVLLGGLPTAGWLGFLYICLDEDGNWDPPDTSLPSDEELDEAPAARDDEHGTPDGPGAPPDRMEPSEEDLIQLDD